MITDTFRLYDSRELVDCAMGRTPATLVIRNGRWVCVQTGEILPGMDIAVFGGRIAYVGPDATHTIGRKTRVIDAGGRYLVPGLLDAHVHVESGLLTVTEFVRAVIARGTTGIFIDPHEIANVFGLQGVRLMVDEAARQPIHVFVQMPSCVPSAPGLEITGAEIGPSEIEEAMGWAGVIGLGEMMNYPGVSSGDPKVHAEMEATRQAGKVIGGHYPSPDLGLPFHGYVAGGPSDDHEGTRLEDAVARARQGMRVMMRYGSGWKDVAEQVRAITEVGLKPDRFLLCTDDAHSETLVSEGHIDRVVRHAISQKLPPMVAIQMATINTAEYFGVSRDIGMIAPGRYADILLVSNLEKVAVDMVIARGEVVAEAGKVLFDLPAFPYPSWVLHSVHLAKPLTASDFEIEAGMHARVTANVIGIVENQAPTRHLHLEMPVVQGCIQVDLNRDIAKLAMIERQLGTGEIKVGLVQGFGFTEKCAVATTMAHDSHQMIVVGTDEEDMALAGNILAGCGGGQVVVRRGEVLGKVELPIAGIISNEHAAIVAQKAGSVLEGFKACGCTLSNPNMQLSLLGLVVIPELRISCKGLIDVNRFQIIPVIERV
ncbi:MAG TPA: adenine deaminase [Anaerolineaceae bacterium]